MGEGTSGCGRVSGPHVAGEARKTCLAVSEWSTHCMAHGRSRSGNVLVPLASGGRHECFAPNPLGSGHLKNRRNGPTACSLVGRENEAEDIDTLALGVQWTTAGAHAVSKVSDFGHK
jgi:hypothetical protein